MTDKLDINSNMQAQITAECKIKEDRENQVQTRERKSLSNKNRRDQIKFEIELNRINNDATQL